MNPKRPHRTNEENMAAIKKILDERVRILFSSAEIEFVIAHQNDTLDELSDYVRQCAEELGHAPARTEIVGGDYLDFRFGDWACVLESSGITNYSTRVFTLPLKSTARYEDEYNKQWELRKKEKKRRKQQAKADHHERKLKHGRKKAAAAAAGGPK